MGKPSIFQRNSLSGWPPTLTHATGQRNQETTTTNLVGWTPGTYSNIAAAADDDDDVAADPEQGLSVVTKRLNRLSNEERERVFEDVHGVSRPPMEEPREIERLLRDMTHLLEEEFFAEGEGLTTALCQAMYQNMDYVHSKCLQYLRACEYVPSRAVEQMKEYWEIKRTYFSPSCLARDLVLNDLTAEEMEYWKTGFMQVCPQPDTCGRTVTMFVGHLFQKYQIPLRSTMRLMMWGTQTLLWDESVQRRGVVHLLYYTGLRDKIFLGDKYAREVVRLSRCCGRKMPALHYLIDHEAMSVRYELYASQLSPYNSVRFRQHYSKNQIDLFRRLQTFGISNLPIRIQQGHNDNSMTIQVQNDFMIQWLEMAKNRELQIGCQLPKLQPRLAMASPPSDQYLEEKVISRPTQDSEDTAVVLEPRAKDIIMGKGSYKGVYKQHPGNLWYRQLLEDRYEEYVVADRTKRAEIFTAILRTVLTEGARFVVLKGFGPSQSWTLLPADKQREKVAHDFRNLRRSKK